jgi:hypothetical protein
MLAAGALEGELDEFLADSDCARELSGEIRIGIRNKLVNRNVLMELPWAGKSSPVIASILEKSRE